MAGGFGSDLWKNVQAVRLRSDGTFQAPVRADGRDGIVVGKDALARADAAHAAEESEVGAPVRRRWWWRLLGR